MLLALAPEKLAALRVRSGCGMAEEGERQGRQRDLLVPLRGDKVGIPQGPK